MSLFDPNLPLPPLYCEEPNPNGNREFLVGFRGHQGRLVMSGPRGWDVKKAAFSRFLVRMSDVIVEERDDAKEHVRNGLPPIREKSPFPSKPLL
jgi:hypothetical protein